MVKKAGPNTTVTTGVAWVFIVPAIVIHGTVTKEWSRAWMSEQA